jgi:hypothetical protein
VGQQGSITRMWAPKGSRPRAIRQQQFEFDKYLCLMLSHNCSTGLSSGASIVKLARSFLDFIICVIIDLLVFCIIRLSLCLKLISKNDFIAIGGKIYIESEFEKKIINKGNNKITELRTILQS